VRLIRFERTYPVCTQYAYILLTCTVLVGVMQLCELITGGGGAQMTPGTLDAINKVLSALLAASSKQQQSAEASSSPSSATVTPSSAGAVDAVQRGGTAAVTSRQQPADVEQPPATAKKSFLKVIDHQNQPAIRAAGTGAVAEPAAGYWQSAVERGDDAVRSRAEDLEEYRRGQASAGDDYRRALPVDDTRRVVHRDGAAVESAYRRPDVAGLGDRYYGGRPADPGRGYDQSAAADPGGHYGSTGRRGAEFWDELSAYCAEYEASNVAGRRAGDRAAGSLLAPRRLPADYSDSLDRERFRRDGGAVDSQLPGRLPSGGANYPDEMDRGRRVGDSSMSDRRADAAAAARHYNYPDEMDRRRGAEGSMSDVRRGHAADTGGGAYRQYHHADDLEHHRRQQPAADWSDAELRRAGRPDDDARRHGSSRVAEVEPGGARGHATHSDRDYRGSSAERSSRH